MAELKLSSGERRSMLVPIVLAVLLLAAAGAWFAKVYVHPAVTGSVSATSVYPVHVEYKAPKYQGPASMAAANQTEDALYVVANVTLENHSEVPLFLSSFHGSFTLEDGSVMQASPIETTDLPRLLKMFPQLKTLTDATGTQPLQREQTVAKGATGRGYLVMYYNVPPGYWEKRKAAYVNVEFYHQDPLTLPLPR